MFCATAQALTALKLRRIPVPSPCTAAPCSPQCGPARHRPKLFMRKFLAGRLPSLASAKIFNAKIFYTKNSDFGQSNLAGRMGQAAGRPTGCRASQAWPASRRAAVRRWTLQRRGTACTRVSLLWGSSDSAGFSPPGTSRSDSK